MMMNGKGAKEDLIHQAFTNPQFLVTSPGSPTLTDSNGNPWCATYVSANADLTVDLRSNMAGECRAKIGYENLIPLTDDPSRSVSNLPQIQQPVFQHVQRQRCPRAVE